MATVQIWKCPKCDFVYKSPCKIEEISHPCRGREKYGVAKASFLKLVKK